VALDIDSYLGVSQTALSLHARRTELLAGNMANADTPQYKAPDIDFRDALAQAGGAGGGALHMVQTQGAHMATAADAAGEAPGTKYRVPLAPSLDGNTVDAQLEQAAFAENAVRYQATLTFLNARFRSLMTAITGQ